MAKLDENKLRYDLMPPECLEAVVQAYTYGVLKYPENPEGWKTTPDPLNRYFAAIMRHLISWRKGELIDPESQLPHTYLIGFNAFCLIWHEKKDKKEEKNVT